MKQKKKKIKVVYREDTGETIYSMAALYGRTPDEQEEFYRKRKNSIAVTFRERLAMIGAAFEVYGPMFLIMTASFAAAAVLLYLYLR